MSRVLEVSVERNKNGLLTGTVKVPEETPLIMVMYAAACLASVVLRNMPDDSGEIMDYIRKQALTILTNYESEKT